MVATSFRVAAGALALSLCCVSRIALGFLPSGGVVAGGRVASRLSAASSHSLDGRPIRGALQPVANFILVKLDDRAIMSDGGIVMPDQTADKPQAGTVVTTGPGRHHPMTGTLIPMCVEKGDRVLFSKWSGSRIKYDSEEHMLIMDDDLLLAQTGKEQQLTVEGLKMIRDQVLVKMGSAESFTDSGIVVAAQTAAKAQEIEGEVVAVGPGRTSSEGKLTPMHVGPGDFVRFRQFAGIDLTIKGDAYTVVRMADVLSKASGSSAGVEEAGSGGKSAAYF